MNAVNGKAVSERSFVHLVFWCCELGLHRFNWPKTKCRRILARGEDQLGAISDVEGLGGVQMGISLHPDHVIIGESHARDRARSSADEPPDQEDEEYWIETINGISISHRAKPARWTYAFGALRTSDLLSLKYRL